MGTEERDLASVSEDGNRGERSCQAALRTTPSEAGWSPYLRWICLAVLPWLIFISEGVSTLLQPPRLTFLAVFRVISDGVSRWMPLMVAKMMGAPGTWRGGREGVQSQAQS